MDSNNEFDNLLREVTLLMKRSCEQIQFMDKKFKDVDLRKPDVIESIALEFILKAFASFCQNISQNRLNYREITELNEKILKIYPDFELRRLDVHYRLDKLSVGWKCANCGYSIPKDVEIHGVRRSPFKLYFICKVCEKKSEITSEGYTAFKEIFGPLYENGYGNWNPLVNRFLWNFD